MIERLKLLIEHYNLTASNFADKIDVPRSSISHLLSGRNKPSLDFVMKVVDTFKEVEIDWMVYGKGTFPEQEGNNIEKILEEESKDNNTPNLFSELKIPSSVEKEIIEDKIINPTENIKVLDHRENEANVVDVTKNLNTRISTNGKKLKKVVLLYDDGSFEEYNS